MDERSAGAGGDVPGGHTPGRPAPGPDDTAVLAPTLATTFYNCALERQRRGDFGGAIADFSEAIRLDPGHATAWSARGIARSALQEWRESLADMREGCRLGMPCRQADSVKLRIWIARARLGERAAGTADLRGEVLSRRDPLPAAWVMLAAGFFCGVVDEAAFLRGVESSDPRHSAEVACETWYFAAMKRLVEGEREGAVRHLTACAATGARELESWWAAGRELAALAR